MPDMQAAGNVRRRDYNRIRLGVLVLPTGKSAGTVPALIVLGLDRIRSICLVQHR
jgi:hypothetical protein